MSVAVLDPVITEEALRDALFDRTRPQRPSPLAASLAFGWRSMLKIKHARCSCST